MRILLFVHCFYPGHIYGTEAYTLGVAKDLQARGHDVRVISTTLQQEPRQEAFISEYEWEGVPVTSYDKNLVPHADIRGTYYQPEMRGHHERLLRHYAPDVVHICHSISHTVAIHEVCAALGIPVFGTLTDFFGICLNNKLQASDDSLCAGPNPSRSNCVACQIKAMSDQPGSPAEPLRGDPKRIGEVAAAMVEGRMDSQSAYGFSVRDIQERPSVIADRYKAALTELIAPSTFLLNAYTANALPVKMRLSHFGVEISRSPKPRSKTPGKLRIGYVGQIAPHKGTHLLIEAARTLDPAGFSLEIWGPFDQDPVYMASLRALSEGMEVRFQGTFEASRTAKILAGFDVLVIPSVWYENSPLILLQALATHTPCIVSDVLGMTEFIEDGVNGYAFRRGDAADLAVALKRFVDDSGLARRLSSTTAYDRTTSEMVDDIVRMYADAGLPIDIGTTAPVPAAATAAASAKRTEKSRKTNVDAARGKA